MAKSAGRVILDNGQEPNADKKKLPEVDRSNMEAFLANLKVILPVVGLDLLKPRPVAAMSTTPSSGPFGAVRFEIRHKSGVKATGVEEEGEFVVLQGSEALKDAGFHSNSYGELRQELLSQDVLVPSVDGNKYTFAHPYPFKSPSAAAAVVLDRNANGRYEWKVVGSKQTYHEWQEDNAKAAEAATAAVPRTAE